MLKNHLLIAFRNLIKQKFYSFLNVFGLAIGLSATLLIGLYIHHELSYDNFHENAERLVKADIALRQGSGDEIRVNVTPDILLGAFAKEFPEVAGGVRLFDPSGFRPSVLEVAGQVYDQPNFIYADSTFFDVFSFSLIAGNPETALSQPNQLVLTEATATKYFNNVNPIGEEVKVNGKVYMITGIMEDAPDNSTIRPTMVASSSSHVGFSRDTWGSANYMTYLLLEENADLATLQSKIQPFMVRQGVSRPADGMFFNIILTPMKDLRLFSPVNSTSDIKFVVIFSAIALLILFIAVINYVNLATARSTSRAKEVGIRKSVGALRPQLLSQFLMESLFLAVVSAVVALVLSILLLPTFNQLTGKEFTDVDILTPLTLQFMGLLTLFIGLLAGIYPALVLTLYKPSQVLKGEFKSSAQGSWLRQILVVLQFSISVFLIISTLVMSKQLKHVQSKELGYDRENVLVVPVKSKLIKGAEAFKSEIINSTVAESISIVGEPPSNIQGGYSARVPGMPEGQYNNVTAVAVDNEYVRTMKMQLLAGSELSAMDVVLADSGQYAFVVNESFLEDFDLELASAIGTPVVMNGRKGEIKGVVEDFHFRPLHQKIAPLVLFPEEQWAYSYALVRISRADPESLTALQDKWLAMEPSMPFTYDFLDVTYNSLYQSETRLAGIFGVFSTVGILIACLGLVGLVSFTAVQKSKEIGIRKVMGASVSQVLNLMMRDFAKLILVSFVISAPLGYVIMGRWLQNFEYKTTIGILPVVLAFGITMLIALVAISYQVIKAATADPIKVLRDE